MNRAGIYITLLWLAAVWNSCSPERKSAAYYQKNKAVISELRTYYDSLYRQQAFAAGFTDKDFKYYAMHITTDTLRSIYNTDKRREELWQSVIRFHYDTVLLKKMAVKMKEIKCLWLGKTEYYFGGQRELFTFISFQSADRAFRENKYYILVFLDHKLDYPQLQEWIKEGKIVPVDSLVYYTTTNRYR